MLLGFTHSLTHYIGHPHYPTAFTPTPSVKSENISTSLLSEHNLFSLPSNPPLSTFLWLQLYTTFLYFY